jgi:hypothetical protein
MKGTIDEVLKDARGDSGEEASSESEGEQDSEDGGEE